LNLVVVVGLSGVVWQWLRAENRLVRLNVVNGIRLAREGDLAGALLWYTEALRLDKFHHGERDTHRLRIGSLLEQTPWLQRVWFSPLPVWLAQLSPQEDRLAIIRGPDAIANRFTGAELRAWDFVNGQAISPPILFSGGRPPMHRIRYQVFSPDGNQVVTIQTHDAAANGVVSEIVVHDAITGKPTLPPLSLEGLVSHVVFSRDGAFLVAAGKAGIARVWDLHRGGEWVGDFKHEGWVTTASFSPDGHYLLTGSMDKTAKLWDLAQREVLFTFPIGRFVMNAEFSHDGQKVVVAGSDFTAGQFRVWDVKTGGLICRPDIGEDGIQGILYHVSFSPDDRFIVAASSYGQVTVWSASTGRIVLPPLRHNNGVLTARFSSDGRQILSASYDTTARLWDARSGAQLAVLNQCMYVLDAAFTRDGRQVITASTDGMVRQWRLPVEPAGVLTMAHSNEVLHAEFSHDGRLVLTASADHKAGLWDAQTGHLLYWLPHEGTVYYATFSLDDKLIVTASEDGTARIWDPATGKQVGLALRHSNTVWHAEFDPTGTRVVTASGNFRTLAGRSSRLIREFPNPGMAERNPGGEARVWDVRTGQPLTGPLRHDDAVVYAGFSPDGNRVITTSADHTAQLWQLPQGAKTGATMKHIGIVFDANFSPNGKWVVTATGGEGSLVKGAAQLWDATTGQRKGRAFEHLDIVYGAKFSRDSRRVVTASDDATARIWDRSSGRALTPPIKNDSVPFGASFSPDDRFILTASEDGAARVWDAANGEFITQIRLHDHRLNSAVFSPNGTHILTASDDGTAKIIALPRTDWTLTDLSLLAEVLSARHLARHGTALEPLDEQQFEDSWTRLVERFPDRFGLSR
jgi:WD40 repeat protein